MNVTVTLHPVGHSRRNIPEDFSELSEQSRNMSAAPASFTPAYPAVGYGAAPVAFGGYPMTYGAVASAAPVERQVFQEQVTVPQQFTTFQTQSYMVNVPQVTCSTTTHTRTRQNLCCERERKGKSFETQGQVLSRKGCERKRGLEFRNSRPGRVAQVCVLGRLDHFHTTRCGAHFFFVCRPR